MEIKKETTAKRCEVCHQEDKFDSETGKCSRCYGIEIDAKQQKVNEQLSLMGFDKQQAQKKINGGVYAGIYLAISTLVVTILAMLSEETNENLQLYVWNFFIAVIWGGLSFGLYSKRSRVCASLLFCFFAIGKILAVINSDFSVLKPLWVVGIVAYCLFQSVMGSIDYHDALDKEKHLLASRK